MSGSRSVASGVGRHGPNGNAAPLPQSGEARQVPIGRSEAREHAGAAAASFRKGSEHRHVRQVHRRVRSPGASSFRGPRAARARVPPLDPGVAEINPR